MQLNSIKAKMTGAVFLLVLFLAVIFTGAVNTFYAHTFRENISKDQFALVTALADSIDDKLEMVQQSLLSSKQLITPELIDDPAEARHFLDTQAGPLAVFNKNLYLLSGSGRLIAGDPVQVDSRGGDFSGRDCFRQCKATGKPAITGPFVTQGMPRRPLITFSAPVFDTGGKLRAVLAGDFDLVRENNPASIDETLLGKGCYVYLCDRNRNLIVHWDSRRTMTKAVPPGSNHLLDRALAGFEGSGETLNSRGVAILASYKRLRTTNWLLAANTPLSEAYAPIFKARQYFILGGVAAAFLSALLIWAVMNYLMSPLIQLTNHIRALSQGTGDRNPAPVNNNDEIGELARTFNTMYASYYEDITALKESEKEILQALSTLSATLDATEDGILVRDLEFRNVLFNKKFAAMWKIPDALEHAHDDATIRALIVEQLTYPAKFLAIIETQMDLLESESCDILELKDGRTFERVSRPQKIDGVIVGMVVCYRDFTERKSLESQLRQSQKLEAIGTLAGGIAHDFNNILTVIVASASLLQRRLDEESPLRRQVDRIFSATERASGLTRGLLAYSRSQVSNPVPIRTNLIVESFFRLLSRLVPENIVFTLSLTDLDPCVMADRGQIDQVLMNLVSNAVDAMADGGTLVIRTDQMIVDPEFIAIHGQGAPGGYALISVEDSGTGVNETIRERIFEPFFTTKETGKGTGLGLSMIYGIVSQHNGFITFSSEPECGSAFRILLPLVHREGHESGATITQSLPGGNETVLLVEDDEAVRQLLKDVLESYGYQIVEAEDGEDALDKFRAQKDRIRLVLSDIMLPKKNGAKAFKEMREIKADIRVIFTSGYSAAATRELLDEKLAYLAKPVSPRELLIRIREELDR
jgi:signal transduction histidine kinase/CheY-like chemotaxis protein/HAMP domain-containing protein